MIKIEDQIKKAGAHARIRLAELKNELESFELKICGNVSEEIIASVVVQGSESQSGLEVTYLVIDSGIGKEGRQQLEQKLGIHISF